MIPILPLKPDVVAAFLRPGMLLVPRHQPSPPAVIERADGITTTLEEQGADGSVRRRTGVSLAIKIGDQIYREHGRGLRIADLWRDYHPPEIPSLLTRHQFDCATIATLRGMEHAGRFEFMPRQASLLAALCQVDGALIAVETGGGKTLLGIALARLRPPRRTLILVPQGVLGQWHSEFTRFWPGQELRRLTAADIRNSQIPDGVWIAYHQEFLLNQGGLISQIKPDVFDMIIVDEAHLLINPDTLMGAALWRLKPAMRYALTATPVPNRISEIYPLCRWLRPDIEYHHTRQKETLKHRDGTTEIANPIEVVSPALFAAELSPVVAALRKIDLRTDLPPCHVSLVRHAMDPEQRTRYSFYETHWTLKRGGAGTIVRVRLNHLLTVCAEGDSIKNRALVDRIMELVNKGESVVVACARTAQADWLESRVGQRVMGAIARIDSTTPSKRHADEAAAFKRGTARVVLIGLKCAYGYSFSNCAWLLIASPEYGLGTVLQTLGRVWRLDSKRPVNCEVHVCAGSVEEDVVRRLAVKESAATSILYGSPSPALLERTER